MYCKRSATSRSILAVLVFLSLSYLSAAQLTGPFGRGNTQSCQPFPPATFYLENTNARALATGDFNGDGILDFAVWTETSGPALTILLGAGKGTFQPGQTYSIGTNSVGAPLAIGDFNGDGKLDVVAANDSDIVIFLGKGNGTFKTPQMTAFYGAQAIAVGDFNQDGKLDLAVASFNDSSNVKVLLGNGDGTFKTPVNYPVTINPDAIAVSDFNHDGHLDLAVANGFGNTVSVLFGNGDGTFRPKVDYQVGYLPYGLTTADLNGDGYADLVTADYNGTASVLLNKGDGTFLPSTIYGLGYSVGQPFRVTAAPLEAGSNPSLAVATTSGTYILVNNGNGTFQAAQGYEPPSSSVVLADFDGDGNTDLAVAGGYVDDGGSGGVSIITGKGHGAFVAATAYIATYSLTSVAVGDFNGDGMADLSGIGADGKPLAILRGQGMGVFSPPVFYRVIPNAPGLTGLDHFAVAAGDFNGDGKSDLAVVTGMVSVQNLQIMLNDGHGHFTFGKSYPVANGFSSELTAADFNNDGILDLAVTGNDEVEILLGNGDGTFRSVSSYAADGIFLRLAVGDFNSDGKVDFAVANPDSSSVSIYLGLGDGTFANVANYSVAFKPSAVAVADFNGDGKADLVVGVGPREDAAGEVQIFTGAGDGTFQGGPRFSGFYGPLAADFDGDGKVDLAAIDLQGFLQILFGNGDGTFTTGSATNIGQGSQFFVAADLNGDQAPDLVIPNYWGGEVSVLLNQCAHR
jgi:hypothetical protein